MKKTVKSLEDKMREAFSLSCSCCYSELSPNRGFLTVRDIDNDMFWGWVDGLSSKWIHDRMSGRCSLQAAIDFDVEEAERGVDRNILEMKSFVKKVGEPIVLTKEEMTKRGYKGYDN